MRRTLIWLILRCTGRSCHAGDVARHSAVVAARPSRPSRPHGSRVRRYLVLAGSLVAVALPMAATATPTVVKPVVIQIKIVDGRPVGGIKRPSVKKGRTVRFVIRTNMGTNVHLHGYDIERKPRTGKLTIVQFVARAPGRFELELHHPDLLLAQLLVRP